MSATPNTSPDGARKRFRILVADDQAVNRKLTMRQLERLGFTVDTAENGRQAVEAMSRTEYDLVFMDCHMPEMDGFAATEEIRRRERNGRRTPIIALTASVVGPERERCTAAGMDDYLTKPVREPDLLRILSQWVLDARPAIDSAKTDILQQIGDDDGVLAEIIGIYLGEAPVRIDGIRKAIAERDARHLAGEAHALCSSSGNIGATRVVDLCTQLEAIGKAGDTDGAAEILQQLESEYTRAEDALEKLRRT
ncbi:MAG TPA: response regulator [Thermoanaerobaculia bacterium]